MNVNLWNYDEGPRITRRREKKRVGIAPVPAFLPSSISFWGAANLQCGVEGFVFRVWARWDDSRFESPDRIEPRWVKFAELLGSAHDRQRQPSIVSRASQVIRTTGLARS